MTNLLAEQFGAVTLLMLKSETNTLKFSREYAYSRINIKTWHFAHKVYLFVSYNFYN
jgi:hypothetical protein